MKIIGLTGSLGSGKTTLAKVFKKLGSHTINADKLVHALYKKNADIMQKVIKAFGKKALLNGRISRKKLAGIAFSKRQNLKRLCNIVYPKTIKLIKAEAKKTKKGIVVLDAPMLIEAGLKNYVDYIVVVKATQKKRLKRCAAIGLKKKDFKKRAAFQMALAKKLKCADFIVDNNGSKRYAESQVKKILEILKGR